MSHQRFRKMGPKKKKETETKNISAISPPPSSTFSHQKKKKNYQNTASSPLSAPLRSAQLKLKLQNQLSDPYPIHQIHQPKLCVV